MFYFVIILFVVYKWGYLKGRTAATEKVFSHIENFFKTKGAEETAKEVLLERGRFSWSNVSDKKTSKFGALLSTLVESVLLLMQAGITRLLTKLGSKAGQ